MVNWYPHSKLGKVSFWLALISFSTMYIQYWIAMIFNISIPLFSGVVVIATICTSGVLSIIAIIKNRDYAISVFLAALIGIFGFFMIIGELIFPH